MLTPRIWDDLPQLSHKIAMNLLGKNLTMDLSG